jgi:type II secretory pathway pseudopilin PulG
MPFSLPMLIPMIIGVVGGVTCSRLYRKYRQTAADRQAKALIQLRQERLEAHRASFNQYLATGEVMSVSNDDEILRA